MGVVQSRRANVVAAVAFSLISMLAIFAFASSPAHAKKKSGKPVVKLSVGTSSQAALAKGKVSVTAKAIKPKKQKKQRVKVNVALTLGSKTIKSAGKASATIKKGKKKTLSIKLTSSAKSLAKKCGTPKLTVTSTTKVGKKQKSSGKAKRTLKKDASLCEPTGPKVVDVPSTVNLDTASRCDFITEGTAPSTECLFPYPNNYFTKTDGSTPTGLRLNLSIDSTPTNAGGTHINPADINTSDGFSPGAPIVTQVPGLDNQTAFDQSGIVSIKEKSSYADADQPIVLIDADTGDRVPIWAEMDSLATSDAQRDLEIHYNKNLTEGHTYIVAMRNLRRADGSTIESPDGFNLYKTPDQVTTNPIVEARRAHFEDIFSKLATAGIARDSLYMAWDFTVASTSNITGRMLDIRDKAFAALGDSTMADGIQQGDAPDFSINPIDGNDAVNGRDGIVNFPLSPVPVSGNGVENIRQINGTFKVPCFLDTTGVTDTDAGDNYINGCPAGSKFKLDANGMPIRTPGLEMTARFTCNIPRSAAQDDGVGGLEVTTPVRTSLYGHGLFGDYTEGNTGDVRKLGNDHGVMVCATDWSGMAEDDVLASALPALQDMSKFSTIPDRLQQGFLNFLFLGRLMKTTAAQGGFAGDPAFQDDHGASFFNDDDLSYYGNSQGGIAGGALTAIAPDFTRSVLYVPGMRYSELLPRSVDFDDYAQILYPSYPIERTRPLLLSMIQSLWDRGEPNGYANHMTSNPLPNTPAHKVLIEMAYGDHQVSNITAEAEARTIGAPIRRPVVDDNRIQPGLIEPWYGEGDLGDLTGPSADGSGAFVWDIGPKRTAASGGTGLPLGQLLYGTNPSPLTNSAPATTDTGPGDDLSLNYGIDPHDTVIRQTPDIRTQIAQFMRADGSIINPCGPDPCYAAGWTGP